MADSSQPPLRIAMLGMIPGNGHPYSWSAIFNGYNREAMEHCPYEVIPRYLESHHSDDKCITNASVTHIWTDDLEEARAVARAACIAEVVDCPEAVIGAVDAVIISTDDGADHVRRARPFVEAGLPVFIDKPLATTRDELRQFIQWQRDGAKILSSSGLRYASTTRELDGTDWRWITAGMAKTWEKYGIHILEPVTTVLGSGYGEVSAIRAGGCATANISHSSGCRVTLATFESSFGGSGVIHAYSDSDHKVVRNNDTYNAFRNQLLAVTQWFRDGKDPYPFSQTVEMMAVLIAGIDSIERQGKAMAVESVLADVM